MQLSMIKASTVEPKGATSSFLRAVNISMSLSAMATGMLTALVLSESVYVMKDSYFTNVDSALRKVSAVAIIQMILILAASIYWHITFKYTEP